MSALDAPVSPAPTGTPVTLPAPSAADRLRELGVATILTPADQAYDAALRGFNLRPTHRPDLVVVARAARDVSAAVRVAARHDLHVTVLGLGHGIQRDIAGGIVVTTAGMSGVEVDREARTATVRAGTRWQDVLDAATPHGLAPLNGSSPLVGVIGYLLGGGMGPVARTYGFAADHVRSLEVVTGSGDVVTASPDQNAELFWALRGGKHGLGIVTEAVIDLFPLRTFFAGGLFFDGSAARSVLSSFAAWSASLPDEATASVAILRLPPLPEIPEPLRGRTVLHLRLAVVTDDAAVAERIVAPMRDAAPRIIDTFGELPYAANAAVHNDPTEPMAVVEGGTLLTDFDQDAVDALLAVAGPEVPTPLVMVEIRRLGGALAREPLHPNAVPGREARYSLFAIGAPVPELDPVMPSIIQELFGALAPWRSARSLPNFLGSANTAEDYRDAWAPEARERLSAVRAAVDPRGLFDFDPDGRN